MGNLTESRPSLPSAGVRLDAWSPVHSRWRGHPPGPLLPMPGNDPFSELPIFDRGVEREVASLPPVPPDGTHWGASWLGEVVEEAEAFHRNNRAGSLRFPWILEEAGLFHGRWNWMEEAAEDLGYGIRRDDWNPICELLEDTLFPHSGGIRVGLREQRLPAAEAARMTDYFFLFLGRGLGEVRGSPAYSRVNRVLGIGRGFSEPLPQAAWPTKETLCPKCHSHLYRQRFGDHVRWACLSHGLLDSREADAGLSPDLCPVCGIPLVEKEGRSGPFIGCSGYPRCWFTQSEWD